MEDDSSKRWPCSPKVRIDLAAKLKAGCKVSDAVYALFWEQAADTLAVLEHYSTPARIAELKAKRNDSETFAPRSQSLSLGMRESLVGHVLARGGKQLLPDKAP